MSRGFQVALGALVACGAFIGVAHAGELSYFSHAWGVTANAAQEPSSEEASWRLYTGRRNLSNESPWVGVQVQAIPENLPAEESFHRTRSLDRANPWGRGTVEPNLPRLERGGVDEKLTF